MTFVRGGLILIVLVCAGILIRGVRLRLQASARQSGVRGLQVRCRVMEHHGQMVVSYFSGSGMQSAEPDRQQEPDTESVSGVGIPSQAWSSCAGQGVAPQPAAQLWPSQQASSEQGMQTSAAGGASAREVARSCILNLSKLGSPRPSMLHHAGKASRPGVTGA